jgi:hypothetical protein
MKHSRFVTIATTIAVALTLLAPTPASATTQTLTPPGIVPPANPEVNCQTYGSPDPSVDDFTLAYLEAMPGKLAEAVAWFSLVRSTINLVTAPPGSILYPSIANASWEKGDDADHYVITSPYGSDEISPHSVLTLPQKQGLSHSIEPGWQIRGDITDNMPSYMTQGAGYVFLTYDVYAVNAAGVRSYWPSELKVTVMRSPGPDAQPRVVCGHIGESPEARYPQDVPPTAEVPPTPEVPETPPTPAVPETPPPVPGTASCTDLPGTTAIPGPYVSVEWANNTGAEYSRTLKSTSTVEKYTYAPLTGGGALFAASSIAKTPAGLQADLRAGAKAVLELKSGSTVINVPLSVTFDATGAPTAVSCGTGPVTPFVPPAPVVTHGEGYSCTDLPTTDYMFRPTITAPMVEVAWPSISGAVSPTLKSTNSIEKHSYSSSYGGARFAASSIAKTPAGLQADLRAGAKAVLELKSGSTVINVPLSVTFDATGAPTAVSCGTGPVTPFVPPAPVVTHGEGYSCTDLPTTDYMFRPTITAPMVEVAWPSISGAVSPTLKSTNSIEKHSYSSSYGGARFAASSIAKTPAGLQADLRAGAKAVLELKSGSTVINVPLNVTFDATGAPTAVKCGTGPVTPFVPPAPVVTHGEGYSCTDLPTTNYMFAPTITAPQVSISWPNGSGDKYARTLKSTNTDQQHSYSSTTAGSVVFAPSSLANVTAGLRGDIRAGGKAVLELRSGSTVINVPLNVTFDAAGTPTAVSCGIPVTTQPEPEPSPAPETSPSPEPAPTPEPAPEPSPVLETPSGTTPTTTPPAPSVACSTVGEGLEETSLRLTWDAIPGATSYRVYLNRSALPPLLLLNISTTSVDVSSGLFNGADEILPGTAPLSLTVTSVAGEPPQDARESVQSNPLGWVYAVQPGLSGVECA